MKDALTLLRHLANIGSCERTAGCPLTGWAGLIPQPFALADRQGICSVLGFSLEREQAVRDFFDGVVAAAVVEKPDGTATFEVFRSSKVADLFWNVTEAQFGPALTQCPSKDDEGVDRG